MLIYRRPVLIILIGLALAIAFGLYFHKQVIQSLNVRKLIAQGLDDRLVPHRINHPDDLTAVLESGLRAFEVDLLFRQDSSGFFFEVGHDEKTASGLRFDSFLAILQSYEPVKVWMDIKNVSEENLEQVIAELERLDTISGIKQLAIIESGITAVSFKKIRNAGFYTSYYLPTVRISKLLESADSVLLLAEALKLQHQIELQAVSAISFDLQLYPFVKHYLEPLLSPEIDYHTWNSIRMWRWCAVDEIKKSAYFQDERVKTILFRLWR